MSRVCRPRHDLLGGPSGPGIGTHIWFGLRDPDCQLILMASTRRTSRACGGCSAFATSGGSRWLPPFSTLAPRPPWPRSSAGCAGNRCPETFPLTPQNMFALASRWSHSESKFCSRRRRRELRFRIQTVVAKCVSGAPRRNCLSNCVDSELSVSRDLSTSHSGPRNSN